jgi:hypothetical protein
MEFEDGAFYRVTKAGYGPDVGMILRLDGFKFRKGRSGRGWYAVFRQGDRPHFVRVSNKKLGPNAFTKASALEALGDCGG